MASERKSRHTHLTQTRLDDPSFAIRSISVAFNTYVRISGHPNLLQSIVNSTSNDLHIRERFLKHRNAACSGNQKSTEDDVLLKNAMVKKHPDSHKSACTSTNLNTPLISTGLIGGVCKLVDLAVHKKHPALLGACAITYAFGKHGVQEKGFTGTIVGLDQKRPDRDVTNHPAKSFLQ